MNTLLTLVAVLAFGCTRIPQVNEQKEEVAEENLKWVETVSSGIIPFERITKFKRFTKPNPIGRDYFEIYDKDGLVDIVTDKREVEKIKKFTNVK